MLSTVTAANCQQRPTNAWNTSLQATLLEPIQKENADLRKQLHDACGQIDCLEAKLEEVLHRLASALTPADYAVPKTLDNHVNNLQESVTSLITRFNSLEDDMAEMLLTLRSLSSAAKLKAAPGSPEKHITQSATGAWPLATATK